MAYSMTKETTSVADSAGVGENPGNPLGPKQPGLALRWEPRYGAHDFFVDDANRRAFSWVAQPALGPLLWIWGPAGSGKTHLAHIWANSFQATDLQTMGLHLPHQKSSPHLDQPSSQHQPTLVSPGQDSGEQPDQDSGQQLGQDSGHHPHTHEPVASKPGPINKGNDLAKASNRYLIIEDLDLYLTGASDSAEPNLHRQLFSSQPTQGPAGQSSFLEARAAVHGAFGAPKNRAFGWPSQDSGPHQSGLPLKALLDESASQGTPCLITSRLSPATVCAQTNLLPDVITRLRSAITCAILPPADELWLQVLAKSLGDLGIRLSRARSLFLLRRLPRTFASIALLTDLIRQLPAGAKLSHRWLRWALDQAQETENRAH
jgi:hypothetical protein